ncbi:gramicidin S biosynthesis protein GrsT [Stigmatella aurantiaca DW4/3-1]|uniref:Gramicidin S biosynthesis protein GrsT n=1 Tax=Stigmatella aurantiaca (strain DW4/3-1) TaxID=378806 RepID=Q08TI8_STIAD|nr:gramicidin S biosynthesis protein GrsT [Stigmatella aurantiaca DW4/3-1]
MRLFCLPHAGGSASLFRHWQAELKPDIEVCPLQLPGREARLQEVPLRDMAVVVKHLVELVSQYTDKPYALFGHSMGALLSFELARAMRSQGLAAPMHLFVASYRAPQVLDDTGVKTKELDPEKILQARRVLDLPAVLTDQLVRVVGPTLLADTALCESYRYVAQPPLSCPVSAFRGSTDYVDAESTEAWREMTHGPFTSRTFLGDHFFLRELPRGLLQTLRRSLSKTTASPPLAVTLHP